MRSRSVDLVALAVFVALVALAAGIGSRFIPGAWYAGLAKPSWTPPNWLFAPVWTVLYVTIAVAGWLAWRSGERGAALAAWGIGLALNAAWSWLFFGLMRTGLALIDIVALWLSILAFIVRAQRQSSAASLMMVPYLLWVGFATALNAAIWWLNP